MHSSGSITRKFGPSWKQSTGHTSSHSVYLHLMQFSVTTKGMEGARVRWRGHFSGLCASCGRMPLQERLQPRALWMRSGEWKSSRLKLLLQGRHRVGLECGEPEKAKARALRQIERASWRERVWK